ncbi:MAG: hypothetical protein AMXMBFR58_11240 [Phycisphaerae bacterium]
MAPGSLEPCREIRYNHRNPLERGLVKRPEDWRWSSVLWWMGHREQEAECALPPGDEEVWTRWKEFVHERDGKHEHQDTGIEAIPVARRGKTPTRRANPGATCLQVQLSFLKDADRQCFRRLAS